ncbi:fibronectin type III domain-containing protein, partial [Candidatus Parcubacteria bacterium]|nr:fibronectin type III domain-containing protein [Candidatus Parcubacteria bacterium]
DQTAAYGINWDTTTATNGSHVITAIARDAAGNTTTATNVTVTVSNTSPPPPPTPTYTYTVQGANITVDGNLSDWSLVSPSITFPVGNNTQQTKIAWNSTYLFISHNVTDSDLRATATIEDNVYLDDELEVFIDTLHNQGSLMQTDDYQFLVNANNLLADLKGTGAGKDITWNSSGVLHSVQRQGTLNDSTTDTGYTVEVAIPWSVLGVTPSQGMIMGLNIGTTDRDTSGSSIANWSGASNWNTPNLWGQVTLGTPASPSSDTTPPTVSLTSPTNGSTVSTTVTVSATASDNVGVSGVTFLLDGNTLGAEDTSSPYSVSWNTAGTSNGTHTLSARARDAAGNTATSAGVSLTVSNSVADTQAPTVPTNLQTTVVSSSQINLTWTASTDNVGVTGYRIYKRGTQIATPSTNSYSDTGLTASTQYTYTVAAVDAVPNVSAQSSSASATTQAASGGGGTSGSTNPLLLPVAQINQPLLTSAYNALNVSAIAAGGSYRDPTTNVKIYKLTSSSFPTTGTSFGHDYFEGGYETSLPYTADGVTRAVHTITSGAAQYIFDFNPTTGAVSNVHSLNGNFRPNADICFTFSNNPATPYYAYVLNGSTLRKIDIRTMTEVTGNGFPVTGAGTTPLWLQQSGNDGEFVWMGSGGDMHHFDTSTQTHIQLINGAANEPRIDRGGRYVMFSMNSPQNALAMWDTQTNTITWTSNGTIPFAHQADLQHLWIGNNWNVSYPFPFVTATPDPNSIQTMWGPSVGTLPIGNGMWMQSGDQRNAWTVWNSYGSINGCSQYCNLNWLAPGGMVLVTANGGSAGARLLGHPYSTQPSYAAFAWPKFTEDGKYVLFTSDMNGSGRYDLFLAEMPTS